MTLPIVRWGMIGAGAVCEKKSGPAFSRVPGSALLSVTRRDPDKLADFARRHQVPKTAPSALELVRDPEVDAVYVATPPDSHAALTVLAAEHGKHVYVEKPMARTHAECEPMVEACERAGVRLFVAYYRRCHPRFVRVQNLLGEAAIGALRSVRVTLARPVPTAPPGWRGDPRVGGGGKFVDLGCHVLDLLEHLVGPIEEIAGVGSRVVSASVEDTVALSASFASGVVAAGLFSFAAERAVDELVFEGDGGAIRLAVFGVGPVTLERVGAVAQVFDEPCPENVQEPLIRAIVDELRGVTPVGSCPSTGRSAARATAHVDVVLSSFRARHGQSW